MVILPVNRSVCWAINNKIIFWLPANKLEIKKLNQDPTPHIDKDRITTIQILYKNPTLMSTQYQFIFFLSLKYTYGKFGFDYKQNNNSDTHNS